MPGRLAIDFGTSNTVVAVWDPGRHEGVPMYVPDYGREFEQTGEKIAIVPSLIHYTADRRQWLGNQVLQQSLYHSERTFRWMKRYIANRSPSKVRLDGRGITHFEAGRDFLKTVLTFAAAELNLGDEEVTLTVPVEAFEHYEDWLVGVAEEAGMPRFRLIDEPSAAALGYGAHIQPGQVYVIFDFGGGTLDVAVVLIDEQAQSAIGRRCRVLGKAGADVGGVTIDRWLFQELLRRNDRTDADEDVRSLSRELLVQCEQAKERLSEYERAEVGVTNPKTGAVLATEFTRSQLEDLLDQHDVYTQIDHTLRRALNAARERGYTEEHITTALMVGGSSLIPSIQKTVRHIFGKERVMLNRPLDAVARGAAAFAAGVDFYDHIQHDYAIRGVSPGEGEYVYDVIIKRGMPYPSNPDKPIERRIIKATYEGQTHLGVAVFEVGEKRQRRSTQAVELVFDPSGAARVIQITPDEEDRRNYFWLNEKSPTFLTADPPATKSEPRFEVEFGIDSNKRLLITARDLNTHRVVYRDYPVVKLS